ncbi:uncharacterized protein METZ01_LOCUS212444 [marine metagenome]|uniref:Uncharacterized protein n=1 Tax=marine metagenome TaxID=408172 RepID=A0A382F9H3_9ZZZZ
MLVDSGPQKRILVVRNDGQHILTE